MKSNRQTGSATSFVIIAVILVVATIGSIAFVVQRGNQVRKDADASKIAEQEATQKAKDAAAKQAAEEANRPAVAVHTDNTPTPSTPSTQPSTTTSTALPETGMEMDIVRLVAIALLSYGAVSFILSRQSLKRSL